MLTFEVARLLDEPELEIYTFFPDYCTDKMPYTADYHFTIYVVRDGNDIFYVGKSDDCCFTRLRAHLGYEFRGHRNLSTLGELIQRNLPHSRQWSVELYTNEDTKRVIPKRMYKGFVHWPTGFAETAMIQTLKPYLNVKLNTGNRRYLPERYG